MSNDKQATINLFIMLWLCFLKLRRKKKSRNGKYAMLLGFLIKKKAFFFILKKKSFVWKESFFFSINFQYRNFCLRVASIQAKTNKTNKPNFLFFIKKKVISF
jgi:hypothetical protein